MTEEMVGAQHRNDEATQGPSVRVNTRTTNIGALKFNTRVCLQEANTPETNSLATADLVRDSPLTRTCQIYANKETATYNSWTLRAKALVKVAMLRKIFSMLMRHSKQYGILERVSPSH